MRLALSQDGSSLDVRAFTQLLNETTNSHKYLFLLALLRRISHTPTHEQVVVPLDEMALDMAALAW